MESTTPQTGFLYRLHPLTKLALVVAAVLIGFAEVNTETAVSLVSWGGVVVLVVLAFLDSPRTAWLLVRTFLTIVLPILISLILVQGFFFPKAQDVIFSIGPLSLKSEGLYFAARIITRLSLVLMATLLLVRTTEPADFTLALTRIGIPREIAYVILSALQLIPRMQAKADSITNAQKARGLTTEGNIVIRLRALVPLIGPLITSALQETEERALALEVRAFRTKGPKTSWRVLHDTTLQRIMRWLLVLAALAIFLWSLFWRG